MDALFVDNDYDHRDPAKGFRVWEALLLYGDLRNRRDHLQHWLNRVCYRNDPETWTRLGFVTRDFDWIAEHAFAQRRLVEKLCRGELTAFGFSSAAPLEAPPKLLHPDRWRILNLDDAGAAMGPTGVVEATVIRVFPAVFAPPPTVNPPGPKPGRKGATRTMWQIAEAILRGPEWRDRRRGWRITLAGEIKGRLPAGMDYDPESIRKMLKGALDDWEKTAAVENRTKSG